MKARENSVEPQLLAQLLLHFITRNYKYFHFSKKYLNYVQQKNVFGIKKLKLLSVVLGSKMCPSLSKGLFCFLISSDLIEISMSSFCISVC